MEEEEEDHSNTCDMTYYDLPGLALTVSMKEDVKRRKQSKNVKKKSFFILLTSVSLGISVKRKPGNVYHNALRD
uniref:Uncharacterized protein n=1 Tax=Cucumis melo TaxID=3656 RepID=A0A9I9EF22_CUCME